MEPGILLLDTGITYTMLTPETAWRAGLQPTRHRPMGLLKVVGGQQVRFPLVPIAALAMGRPSSRTCRWVSWLPSRDRAPSMVCWVEIFWSILR